MKRFETLSPKIISETSKLAKASPRLRRNYNFHELPDTVQRMLNAVEPDSYIRPHRHTTPPKTETFLVLTGSFKVLIFDDDGNVTDTVLLTPSGNRGVDILPGVWHSVVSLESGSVFFEVKPGPYIAASDKDFAGFAPPEGSPEAREYLKWMMAQ